MSFFDTLPFVLGDPAVAEALRRRALGDQGAVQQGNTGIERGEGQVHTAAQKMLANIRQRELGKAGEFATAMSAENPASGRVAPIAGRANSIPVGKAPVQGVGVKAPVQGLGVEAQAKAKMSDWPGSDEPITLSSTAPDYGAVPGASGGSGKTYGFSVEDLVEPDKQIFMAEDTPIVIGGKPGEQPSYRLRKGVTPDQFLMELNSRAEAELGFTAESARRFKEQTGQEPVGRFFYGVEPRHATLNAETLLKTIRIGPDGKAIFQLVVPPASEASYANFFEPQRRQERAETQAIIERERAKVQASGADRASHWLIRNAPIIGPIEDLWPEAGRNVRQAVEEATRRATLGWIDPTLGGKAQGDRYNTAGATVGGIAGGIVPMAVTAAALTAAGQPELIPLAVGVQPMIERRPEEKAYDLRRRSLEGLAQGGTVWAAGAIPEGGGFFKTLAADQVPFVAGPYGTTPFVANRFPTGKETVQQAALGLSMPLAHRALGGRASDWNADETVRYMPTRSVETYLGAAQDPTVKVYPGRLGISKFHGLRTEERANEARLAHYAETNTERLLRGYRAKHTLNGVLTLATDEMRELMPGYSDSQQSRAEKTMSTQTPAGALVAALWKRALNERGNTNHVVFTAGGAGAGKTSSRNTVLGELAGRVDLVYEGTMSDIGPSRAKIQQALNAGKEVTIVFTYAEPYQAARRAFGRAVDGDGRPVRHDVMASQHFLSPRTIVKLYDEFKTNPLVKFRVMENTGSQGDAKVRDIDYLRKMINNQERAGSARQHVQEAVDKGIQDEYAERESRGAKPPGYIYRGFMGKHDPGREKRLDSGAVRKGAKTAPAGKRDQVGNGPGTSAFLMTPASGGGWPLQGINSGNSRRGFLQELKRQFGPRSFFDALPDYA